MVMRVGGLATGMDIEAMVNKLMEAERMPLDRLHQDRTQLEWKRDSFREMNRSLLALEQSLRDMRLPSTYAPKKVTSSQESAVTATGSSTAPNGSYSIRVTELATNAIVMSEKTFDDLESTFELGNDKTIEISTIGGDPIIIEHGDKLKDVIKNINDSDSNVRAFYDQQSQKLVIETTRTGKYNTDGPEIIFGGTGDVSQYFNVDEDNEVIVTGGTDAVFYYNEQKFTSKDNSYSLNGIHFNFHNVTESNARITVDNDVEASFDKIVKFVNQYNEVIDKLNGSQQEEKFRDFKPLTSEQKKAMSEDEIKQWEEKAKSGVIRGESSITNGLLSMRSSWYGTVQTGTDLTSITQIGITTSARYMDGGKLEIDEDKLRAALRENPDDVQKLFVNSSIGDDRGIANRLTDAVNSTMSQIDKQAGKDYHTLENYNIGKRMKNLNDQISTFERRMFSVENRYWNQFTQMEKAIQRLNDQSAQLFSQFG